MTALFGAGEITWDDHPDLLPCFLCHTLLTFPAVHWLGSTGHIYLDEACVPALFERLAVDTYMIRRGRRMRGAS